jgi:regulator of protease activity HflC (stomatin/prohibitin superfamily)
MIRIVAASVAGVAGLVAMSTLFGSWYTVDQGYRGVILRNGAIVGTAQPGLGFKMPWIDSVLDISVQEHVAVYGAENPMLAYSYDQQTAGIRLSANFTIPAGAVADVYAKFGGEEGLRTRILDPRVFKAVKDIFGQFTAAKSIQDRQSLSAQILTNLQASVEGEPITVTSVQIENIDFSDAYENSIEQRMQAEIEVQKLRQNAEREKVQAQIIVIQAQAAADATVANAKANAESTILRGDAEAKAIRVKGEALRDNPQLVDLVTAEKWNGSLPTTMVPNSTVPFLSVAK